MQGHLTIANLIQQIEQTQLILPEFQRGYVWNRQQVREYLKSLYRGYPTGSFLIWTTPDPGQVRSSAPVAGDAKVFQLILDGQQRLTSIYAVMKGQAPPFYEGEKLFFDLWFNLLTEELAYYKKITMAGKPEWIPVTEFLQQGIADFFTEHMEASDIYGEKANFAKLARLDNLRNYSYYIDTIGEEEIEQVVEIFNLVNSKGTRLAESDLALAHICASWPEARQDFRRAKDELAAENFDFDLGVFTRIAATVATESGKYDPIYRTPIEEVKDAWKRGKQALEYLLNVLRADAYIDSAKHLKTPFVLYPLVTHLARSGGAFRDAREKREFLHWMLAALMWGRYSGSSETKLNLDLQALAEDDPPSVLRERIVRERGRIEVQGGDLALAGVRSTFYPITYIVARARDARDWFNGSPLWEPNVGKLFALEAHHIFPQSLLYKELYPGRTSRDQQLVNQIANLAFLTKTANLKISNDTPADYLRQVKERYPGELEKQFVPTEESLWHVERYEDFCRERRRLIAEAINQFMDGLIAGEVPPLTSIEELIARGEDMGIEFKGSLRWDYRQEKVNKALTSSVIKTLAAFLNKDGGTLLIGVMDDGAVVGLGKDYETLGSKGNRDGFELTLRNAFGSALGEDVGPYVEVTFAEVDGQTVAAVSCEAHHKPVFVTEGDRTEFYVRAGNKSALLNVKEASAYINDRWGTPAVQAVA